MQSFKFNKLAFLTSILILLSSCKGKSNDLQIANLKGEIELISESEYSALRKFGEAVKDTFQTKAIYKYNKKGYLIEYWRYNSKNETQFYVLHEYDNNNKALSTSVYNEKDSLTSKELPTNYKNNLISESIQYNAEGKPLEKYIYIYDDRGNRIEWSVYDLNDTLLTKSTSIYDENNNMTEGILHINLTSYKQTNESRYTYNENNDVIEENVSYADDNSKTKTTYKYKYDKNGNWIAKQTFFQDGTAKIIEREIKYRD